MSAEGVAKFPKGIQYLPGLPNKDRAIHRLPNRASLPPLAGSKLAPAASKDPPPRDETSSGQWDDSCGNERSSALSGIKINSIARIDLFLISRTSHEKVNSALIQKQFRSVVTLPSQKRPQLKILRKQTGIQKNQLFHNQRKIINSLSFDSSAHKSLPRCYLMIFAMCSDVRNGSAARCLNLVV